MAKRRDQQRYVCPKCKLSKLMSAGEAAVHQRDCTRKVPRHSQQKKKET